MRLNDTFVAKETGNTIIYNIPYHIETEDFLFNFDILKDLICRLFTNHLGSKHNI
jgi:hypothetical protein